MNVAVIGAGGVGGLLAALLARMGHDVAILARGEALAAIRARGIVARTAKDETIEVAVRASDDAAELGRADVVLVAVKAWQVEAMAPRLAPLVGEGTLVVPLQNGVDAADTLAKSLGTAAVTGGLCHMLSWIESPGVIRAIGAPPSVTVGPRDPSQRARIDALVTALRAAGVHTVVPDDVNVALWEKFIFLEPFGAVGAVTRSPVATVRTTASSRALLIGAAREVEAVGRARGVAIPDDAVARAIQRVESLPADATASLQRDLEAGRPSELADLTGAVVRHAEATGTPTPIHGVLWGALEPWEARARQGGV